MSTSTYIDILNDIENTVRNMTTDELEVLSHETSETLEAIMTELKKRQADQRHAEIDNLEAHFQSADTSFKALRDFIKTALKEMRK